MRDRSGIFAVYNRLRLLGDSRVDPGRLKRALGLAQSDDPLTKYYTTLQGCTCPDAQMRGGSFICKHRLAMLMRNPTEAAIKIYEESL